MKAKVKAGKELLFNEGNHWNNLKDNIIINFNDKNIYKRFKQKDNHLLIFTTKGLINIVFCSEVPTLEFNNYEKDQLILNIKRFG